MKKNCSRWMLSALLLLAVAANLSAQKRKVPVPLPQTLMAKAKKATPSKAGLRTLGSSLSLTLTRQSQIDSVPILYPGVTAVQDVFIDGTDASPAITNLDSLKYITQIASQLNISHTSVTNLNGLSGLQSIGWILWLDSDSLLANIKPPNITYINGLVLNNLPLFTSFSGFLNGLTNTRFDYFWMFNNIPITDFNGLQGIDSINHVGCWGLPNFQRFSGIDGFHYCESIDIWGNGQLTDVSAFHNITQLPWGSLQVSYNYNLTSWNGLQNITYIGGVLSIQGTDFSSLSATGLNPALSIGWIFNSDTLTISDNYNMSVCGWAPLCNYLAEGKPAHIYNNAPGCENITEVQASCSICPTVGLKTWNGSNDNDWNNPANWTPMGVPASCDSVVVHDGALNRPELTADATVHALTMEPNTELYMNYHSITVNGDVNLQNVSMGSSGCDCESFTANNSRVINMDGSQLYMRHINLIGYRDSLTLTNNNLDKDVVITDGTNRLYNHISGNTFGSLAYTSNSANPDEYSEMSTDNDDYINGNFTINIPVSNSPNPFIVGVDHQVHIGGDLIVNNDVPNYLKLRNIEFSSGNTGNNDCHVTQAGSEPISFEMLATNKGSLNSNPFASIILDQTVYVTRDVHLNVGHIKTSPTSLLVLQDGANFSQWSSASWIWGPLKVMSINGNSQQIFPIGDSIWRGETYLKNVGNNALPNAGFTVQYFHKNPSADGFDTSLHDASLKVISGNEYWKFKQDSMGGNLKVVLRYDPAVSQLTNSVYGLRVSHWDGTQWKNNGAAQIDSGGWAVITPDSISTNLGVYTLGYNSAYHRPVITITNVDTLSCMYTPIWVRWTVDSAMLSSNQFNIYLSDSSGNFVFNNGLGYYLGTKTSTHSDSLQVFTTYGLPNGDNYKIRIVGTQPVDTSVNTKTIKLRSAPLAASGAFNIAGPSTPCANTPLKYYTSQRLPTATGYRWDIYGGTILQQNSDTVIVSWNNPPYAGYYGSDYLHVTAYNGCGNGASYYFLPTVYSPPPATAPVITNTGRWLYVSAPPANQGITINWYRDGTLVTGANNTSYYASATGTYTAGYSTACATGPASNSVAFAANAVSQSITFTPIGTKTYTDSSFVLNASASSGLPVEFTIISGPGNILGNVFYIKGTGTVTVRALQAGNNAYDTATYVQQSFVINKASQTITFAPIADKDYTVGSFALSATTTSGLPITYAVQSGPATISGNTLTLTGVGTVTVRASQDGDDNYLAALPVDRSFCVRVASLNGINGPISICPGIAATYTTTNVPGATYNWRLQGGNTFASATNTLTTTWPSPGTYTLIVNASGSCGSPSKNDTLVVTAITSVQPDSVHNMLPANGAINQQLPLTLSWIPAAPNLFYTYDVYVWKASDPQPSTPFVSNITTVNYTIPLNSGLTYNTTYKWMVVAHNGSCAQINTGPVQQFTLIPLPDLEVYNVSAPVTAFSGQPISVTWKVKNNGPGNTQLNQNWTDAVFISKDSVLDFTNPANQLHFPVIPLLVATKSNVSALNTGDSYGDTATFTLPVDYSGPLYMHVVTNYAPPAANQVIEMTYANDTAHALPLTQVTLSPQPDFRVDTVVNPGNTFSGSTINVTFKVKNYGVTATGNWVDKIYLSKDAIFNPSTALRLNYSTYNGAYFPMNPLDVQRNGNLQADSSYTVSVQAVVPNFIFGQYYVYVVTNATGSVYEGANGGNNVNRGNLMQIFLTPTPLLVPTNLTTSNTVTTAGTLNVAWNTYNNGAYDNIQKNLYPFGTQDTLHPWGRSQWYDRAYLSTNPTGLNVTTDLLIADVNQNADIYPGKGFPVQQSWAVPDNLPTGDYYVYAFANATRSVYEYPGQPQIVRSQKITIVHPDLSVPSVNVPANGSSGQNIVVNYTVLNNTAGAVNDRYRRDYIYLGSNPSFDATAVLIDSAIYTSYTITANGLVNLQKGVTLPNGVSGAKYIFVKTNGAASFTESDFSNNTSVNGAPINIALTPSPDLLVSSINMNSAVTSSTGFPFAYTVTNNGPGVAQGTWKDSIYVSCNSTFSYATASYVADRTQQLYLPASSSYTDSFNLKMPQTFLISNSGCLNNDVAQVYFFVKTNAGNGIYEVNTANNISGTIQRTVTNAIVDQVVSSVRNDDSTSVGRAVKVAWTVKNLGLNPADNTYSGWYDGIYLSADSVLSGEDKLLGYKYENTRLNTAATYSDSAYFNIPDVPSGYYYLIVNTNLSNAIPAERNLANNSNLRRDGNNTPVKVYITNPPPPDLTVTVSNAPASIAVGQPLKIVYTVTNNGTSATYPAVFYNRIWLSNNFSESGFFVGEHPVNTILQPGQSVTDSITTTLPLNFTQGNYVIVVRANTGSVYEANYSNNYAYKYISVYTPAPVDLMVNNVAAADTVTLGYAADVSWRIFNNSNNPANGVETDGIYLSTDSTSSNTVDVLVGTKTDTLNLLPLNSTDFISHPVISGVPEGSYYLKVRTDILRNIIETNTSNNTGLLNKKVYVTVKVLPMNTIMPDALTNGYLYYKLIIPTALKGKTIQVKLTSPDSLTAANQLFIGLGYLPSAAKSDYTYSAASAGNQQIIIESVIDSVYYIAARATKGGTQQITLQAIQLPFALLTVNSNHGGNTGNVTVKLNGTLFSSGMTATIHGQAQNNSINATSFYFVNGTTAYATFNLHGAPLGLYDVSLTKADNSVAVLPSSFTVEKGSNGGLLTGGDNVGQTGTGNAPGCDPGAAGGLNTQLQTELNIPPKVFSKWPFVITINYTNASNVDIPAQVRILYSQDGAPLGLTEADLAAGKTTLYIEFKDSFGASNVIRAGSTGTIRVYSKAPPTATAHSFVHFNLQ